MQLLGSNKNVISKDSETSENVPELELLDAVLMHSSVVNNNYQQSSKLLFTSLPDKQFR